MGRVAESRRPITIREFTRGIILKNDTFGDPTFMRLNGFKFGKKIGTLESRGGFADWDLNTDFTYLNGLKRWYREDGGVNTFLVAIQAGGIRRLWTIDLGAKSVTTLQALDTEDIDDEAAVQWVDCGSQLLCLPYNPLNRPFTVKLRNIEGEGGVWAMRLGLDPPTNTIVANAFGVAPTGVNTQARSMIEAGTYKYAFTYSYGTVSEPQKYGESGLSPIGIIRFSSSTAGYVGGADKNGIIQITGWPTSQNNLFIQRINIYRTKKDDVTLYKIGELYYYNNAISNNVFNDAINDSFIDTSKTPPTLTGLPGAVRAAMWHPQFQRLFWFGFDGYYHFSAAGFPDINPTTQKIAVGDTGYPGHFITLIRDNIYAFKEDGIFFVDGSAPNYFSRKIESIKCSSAFAEMPDGIYFLGASEKDTRVYRFDGNQSTPISGALDEILPQNKDSVLKRAFGRRVGDEYWLSIMISDRKYCYWPNPYNNVILAYNYKNQQWTSFPAQATAIESFDGPGDSGETFIIESDPTNSAAKGNLFRLEDRIAYGNLTKYQNGTRTYSKTVVNSRVITFGPLPGLGISSDKSLEKIVIQALKIRQKYYPNQSPTLMIYEDTKVLEKALSGPFSPELLEKFSQEDLTGDNASKWNTGKWNSMILEENYQEELLYNIDEKIRTGIILDLSYGLSDSFKIELQALEPLIDSTNNE